MSISSELIHPHCEHRICSPCWQGAWQPRLPSSFACLWSSPPVLSEECSLLDKGVSPEQQSSELAALIL